MSRLFAGLAAVTVAAVMFGQSGDRPASPAPGEPPARVVPSGHERSAFRTVDIEIDSGAAGLAAWQVEFVPRVRGARVTLVGIEGGDPGGVFAKPAYYDAAALAPDGGGRVILAAFSLERGEKLPTGRTRVARLHLFIEAEDEGAGVSAVGDADWTTELRVAADAGGGAIKGAAAAAKTGDDR